MMDKAAEGIDKFGDKLDTINPLNTNNEFGKFLNTATGGLSGKLHAAGTDLRKTLFGNEDPDKPKDPGAPVKYEFKEQEHYSDLGGLIPNYVKRPHGDLAMPGFMFNTAPNERYELKNH